MSHHNGAIERVEASIKCYPQPLYQAPVRHIPSESQVAAYRQYQAQLRAYQDWKHEQRNEAIGRMFLGIGVAVVGAIGLLLALAVFASSVRPIPEPATQINPECRAFCRVGSP